ncbi:hypothetical protein Harman_24890 [Haloarcula mannanilytica]|uniref:Uncharacterized protein n=1 Tax=Haloarcula mannanilytica TaxID=2509225 RepID=A0A4C2EJ94_9EURY|nr:hypothetical protein Harman_24890 [Haloarcula mannanilytica]
MTAPVGTRDQPLFGFEWRAQNQSRTLSGSGTVMSIYQSCQSITLPPGAVAQSTCPDLFVRGQNTHVRPV